MVWEVACSKLSGNIPYLVPDVLYRSSLFVQWVTTTMISPLLSHFDLMLKRISGEFGSLYYIQLEGYFFETNTNRKNDMV